MDSASRSSKAEARNKSDRAANHKNASSSRNKDNKRSRDEEDNKKKARGRGASSSNATPGAQSSSSSGHRTKSPKSSSSGRSTTSDRRPTRKVDEKADARKERSRGKNGGGGSSSAPGAHSSSSAAPSGKGSRARSTNRGGKKEDDESGKAQSSRRRDEKAEARKERSKGGSAVVGAHSSSSSAAAPSGKGSRVIRGKKDDRGEARIRAKERGSGPRSNNKNREKREREKAGKNNKAVPNIAGVITPSDDDDDDDEALVCADIVEEEDEIAKEEARKKELETVKLAERNKAKAETDALRTQLEEAQRAAAEAEKKKKKRRRTIIIIIVLFLVIAGGVGAYFGLTGGSDPQTLTDDPANNTAADDTPAFVFRYSPPRPEDCETLGNGLARDAQEDLISENFDMEMEVEFSSGSTGDEVDSSLLPELQEAIRKILIPDLAGCEDLPDQRRLLEDRAASVRGVGARQRRLNDDEVRYVIYDGTVAVNDLQDRMCFDESNQPCYVVGAKLDLRLQGEEPIASVLEIIGDVFVPGQDLRPRLVLEVPFVKITVMNFMAIDDNATVDPSTQPSLAPSTNPSNVSTNPPGAPVVPDSTAPSGTPSFEPSPGTGNGSVPGITPSPTCSDIDIASFFDASEPAFLELDGGQDVTYNVDCASQTDLVVLSQEESSCTVQCLANLSFLVFSGVCSSVQNGIISATLVGDFRGTTVFVGPLEPSVSVQCLQTLTLETSSPSQTPSTAPSSSPSALPSFTPSSGPTLEPTAVATATPTASPPPTASPTVAASAPPTVNTSSSSPTSATPSPTVATSSPPSVAPPPSEMPSAASASPTSASPTLGPLVCADGLSVCTTYYNFETCFNEAYTAGLQIFGGVPPYLNSLLTKGCYFYNSDHPTYPNTAFFGTGGTDAEMETTCGLSLPDQIRFPCACSYTDEVSCQRAAEAKGLQLGDGGSTPFVGDYAIKGCYYYGPNSSSFPNQAYFGTGGTAAQMHNAGPFTDNRFRMVCDA